MTKPAEPDPLVAVLAEIRDVLAEIRDRMPAARVSPAAMAMPVRPSPAPRERGPHIVG